MEGELDISLKNNVFKSDGSLIQIKWGTFECPDGSTKFAAFRISPLEANDARRNGRDIEAESLAIIERDDAKNGPKFQAYEWNHDGFEIVDADTQTWFKFL